MMTAHRLLGARKATLLAAWRRRFRPAPPLAEAALAALEFLLFPITRRDSGQVAAGRRFHEQIRHPRPPVEAHPQATVTGAPSAQRRGGSGSDPAKSGEPHSEAALWEQVQYTAARLAKLNVPLAQVNAALGAFQPLAAAALSSHLGARAAGAVACQWQQEATMAVAEAYVNTHSGAVQTLLAVLDAELNAGDPNELLERLLRHAAQLFPIRCGEILLVESGGRLRHAAAYGLEPGAVSASAGAGTFLRDIVREARPGFLDDAAHDPRVRQPYYRALEIKSLWAVPLIRRHPPQARRAPRSEVLGVLAVAFDRVYDCLPQEQELLLALAERSTLALERTRMAERLGEQQRRVLELSRRLLDAQDEERRRISRDLHDETGQSLLALRLYLEMGLREAQRPQARMWLEKGLNLVDSSVAELRRILAQLSPLLLDELGLEAALRLELRRLQAQQGWRVRFRFVAGEGSLETPRAQRAAPALHGSPSTSDQPERPRAKWRATPPRMDRSLEILVYRVVLEGLRNIARHARARHVNLTVTAGAAGEDRLTIQLSDDGVGLGAGIQPGAAAASPDSVDAPIHFGLAGMRERVRLAGGKLEFGASPSRSAHGRGLRLSIDLPMTAPTAAPPARAAHAS
jgi:signal transduction histidine kinase